MLLLWYSIALRISAGNLNCYDFLKFLILPAFDALLLIGYKRVRNFLRIFLLDYNHFWCNNMQFMATDWSITYDKIYCVSKLMSCTFMFFTIKTFIMNKKPKTCRCNIFYTKIEFICWTRLLHIYIELSYLKVSNRLSCWYTRIMSSKGCYRVFVNFLITLINVNTDQEAVT